MSPRTAAAIAAARNRRTPHGKGRFDPSEPLHMTTRHAARNGRVNETPSPNGSMEDYESRPDSFDDTNAMSSQSLGSPDSIKGRRISGTSANGASAANFSFETQSSTGKLFESAHSDQMSPIYQSTSPSRKRKRSTSTPLDGINGVEESLINSVTDLMERDPRDFVEVVPPEDLSDRSVGSAESDEQFAVDYLGATQSTENTPAATPLGSQAVSPVSEESNPDVFFPTKHSSVAKAEVTKVAEPEDDIEDAEELVEADEVDDGDEIEDGDDQAREDLDGRPRRRLAGRRRAEHHDPTIEAAMRRQLQLKSTFRSIARALKPVLAEIAQKTVENLEEDPSLHEQVVEYQGTDEEAGIQQLLDDALARRKAQLDAQFRWNYSNLQKTLEGEDKVRRSRCELQTEDLRDLQMDRLEHDLLTVARSAQLNSGDPGFETEDEGEDVVPQPQGMGYKFVRTGALDSKYDSRSRLALECERAVYDLQTRFDMFKMLKDVHEDDRPDGMAGFTTMNSTAREAANARRESILNTKILADAAAETERIEKTPVIPVIPNEQAAGLQALGEIAEQFARAAAMPPEIPQEPASFPRAATPPQMPPPPPQSNHLPMVFEGPSQLTSPRSSGFSERQILPFASPLQPQPSRETRPSQSPRKEQSILPPMFPSDRGNTLPPFNMQPRDADFHMRHGSLPPPPPPPPSDQHLSHPQRDMFGRDRTHREIFGSGIARPEVPEYSYGGAQSREESPWEQYHRSLNVERSPRPLSHPDRSVHEFSQGGPLRIERVDPSEAQKKRQNLRPLINNDSFMIDPALTGPTPPQDVQNNFGRPSPMIDSEPGRSQPQDPRGPMSRASPPIDPALTRPHLHESRGPSNHETVMIDPALSRPLLQEEYRPGHHASPSFQPAQARSHPPWEKPSSPGATDSRETGEPSPMLMARDTMVDELSKKPRSRTSSILSQSTTTEVSPDVSVAGDPSARKHSMKTKKAERKGSRRMFKEQMFKEHKPGLSRKSQNGKGSEGGPSVYRFRLNSTESTQKTPWSNATSTPQRSSLGNEQWAPVQFGPPPPPPSGRPIPPAPPGGFVHAHPYDYNDSFQHRDSFTSSGPPWGTQPPPPVQSPLYAVPPPLQPQPGGGPPPDQWPSPSAFVPPPRPSHTPRNNQQTAGPPPLAPATPDIQRPLASGGPSTNHLPAFAQQQRNQEANPRRRAHSEIQGHSFKHWAPRTSK